MIGFYRGLKAYYNAETYVDALYFCTDTKEILMNGNSYGFSPEDTDINLVSMVEWVSPDSIKFTTSNGNTIIVTIPTASKSEDGTYTTGLISAEDLERLDNFVTEDEVNLLIVGVYHFKGVVDTYEDLPTDNLSEGDTYKVREAFDTEEGHFAEGTHVVWNGSLWYPMEGESGYSREEADDLFVAKEDYPIYNLGNFDTLDAVSVYTAGHNYYNDPDKLIMYFTVGNVDKGIIINSYGDISDGYAYTNRLYLYYQEHRYTRTVKRGSDGNVTYTAWVIEDNVTLANKGVIAYDLFNLTEDAADADIQAALTYPNGDGVITADDLAACEEKGMFLRDYGTNAQLIVGRTNSNSQYTITYVGYPMTASSVDTSKATTVTSVVFTITDGVYKIVKAANTAEVLTTDWEKYPLEIKIPLWSLSDRVYSESTILGWFGCDSIDEFKEKAKDTALLSLLYLNSGDMYYRIPVQFIEFKDSDNQIHIVTTGLDMSDDSAAKLEITINIDGTVFEDTNSNISYIKEELGLLNWVDVES